LLPIIGHSQVGLRGRIRSVLEHNTLAMMGMRCALSYLATQSWKRCGDPAMIPDDQKQLNIAFPKLTMTYVTRRDTEHCVWVSSFMQWLQNFHNDKLLYSGSG